MVDETDPYSGPSPEAKLLARALYIVLRIASPADLNRIFVRELADRAEHHPEEWGKVQSFIEEVYSTDAAFIMEEAVRVAYSTPSISPVSIISIISERHADQPNEGITVTVEGGAVPGQHLVFDPPIELHAGDTLLITDHPDEEALMEAAEARADEIKLHGPYYPPEGRD